MDTQTRSFSLPLQYVPLSARHPAEIMAKLWGWGVLGRSFHRSSPLLLSNLQDVTSVSLRKPVWCLTEQNKVSRWEDCEVVEGHGIVRLTSLLGEPCKQVTAMGNTLLLVDAEGKIRKGEEAGLTWTPSYPLHSFTLIACGNEHVLGVTATGQALTWGKGAKGKLGQGTSVQESLEPGVVKGLEDVEILQVACGFSHNLVLGQVHGETRVFSWGSGADGRLGHDSLEDCYEAVPIKSLSGREVLQVLAGFLHSVVITRAGEVLSFGFNGYGQLGLGGLEIATLPTVCLGLSEQKVVTGQCGAFHTVLACESGALYSMGLGTKGQLGNGRIVSAQSWPTLVNWRSAAPITTTDLTLICGPDTTLMVTSLVRGLTSPTHSLLNENSTRENSKESSEFAFPQVGAVDHGFRPQNLPPKSREEIEFHRRLVAENTRKYLEKLQEREREQQALKAKQLAREEEIRVMMRIWVEDILPSWDRKKRLKSTERLWRRGLPPRVRGEIWLKQLGNTVAVTPDLYEISVQKAQRLREKPEEGLGKENTVRLVSQDIARTFNQFGFFREGSPLNVQLRDMLEAFALYRPDIGYVQGMSYLAGILLLNLEPYKAFVALVHIVGSPALLPFYLMDEAGISTRCQLFKVLFKLNLPELCDHFESEGVQPKMFLIDWFLTLFARTLSQDVACRVWDLYFLEGFILLYRTALALLKLLTYMLLPEDITGIMRLLSNLAGVITDADVLAEAIAETEVPEWVAKELELLLSSTVYY